MAPSLMPIVCLMLVAERFAEVQARISAAAVKYGRHREDICLIAVSKNQTIKAITELALLGQKDFGENYLQEALPKISLLKENSLVWHFIGQLQSNKTRVIAEQFDWVHTLDRAKLAERLNTQRPSHKAPLQVCIEVQLSDEAGKGGIHCSELPALIETVAAAPRLQLRGLMAIPPIESTLPAQARWFCALRDLKQQLCESHPYLDTLSMGMSGDLEAAVSAGSTHLRIGSSLFGTRTPLPPKID